MALKAAQDDMTNAADAKIFIYQRLMAAMELLKPQEAARYIGLDLREWINRQFNSTPEQRAELREFVLALYELSDRIEEAERKADRARRPFWRRIFG